MMALWPCAWAQHNPLGGFVYGDKEAPTGKEWESVEELALNKEYPRAYFFSFDNEAQAAQVRPEKSPYWLSLNSQWPQNLQILRLNQSSIILNREMKVLNPICRTSF